MMEETRIFMLNEALLAALPQTGNTFRMQCLKDCNLSENEAAPGIFGTAAGMRHFPGRQKLWREREV